MAAGIGVTEHASAADTAQRSPGRFRGWRLLPAFPGGTHFHCKQAPLAPELLPERGNCPLGLSPGFAKEEKWNWMLGRSLGGFPAWEPSVTVYNVQKTTRSQRSFEALGSAC